MTLLSWLKREMSRTLKVTLMAWTLAGAAVLLYLGSSDWQQWNRMSESWVEQASFHTETRTIRQLEISSSLYLQSFPFSSLTISNDGSETTTSTGQLWTYPLAQGATPPLSMTFRKSHGRLTYEIFSPSTSIFRRAISFLTLYLVTTLGISALGYLAIRHSIRLALNELQALHRPDRTSVVKEFNEMKETVTRLEEERQRYRTDAKLGRLQSQIAHDLRAPLGALGTLATLKNWQESERELLREATERIRSIAAEVLEQRKSSLVETSADGLLRILRAEAARHEKEIAFRMRLSSLGQVSQELREELFRHLINLAFNSIESVSKSGEVSLEAVWIEGGLSVRVCDTGPGFRRQTLERIQLGLTPASSKTSGNGLAIRACQEWLQERGGKLSARNVDTGGAEVILTLPMSTVIPPPIRAVR